MDAMSMNQSFETVQMALNTPPLPLPPGWSPGSVRANKGVAVLL